MYNFFLTECSYSPAFYIERRHPILRESSLGWEISKGHNPGCRIFWLGENLEFPHFTDRDLAAWREVLYFISGRVETRNDMLIASDEFSLSKLYKIRQILFLFCF